MKDVGPQVSSVARGILNVDYDVAKQLDVLLITAPSKVIIDHH